MGHPSLNADDRLTQFKLQAPGIADLLVLIGDASRLEKLTGRLPRQNLFGNLTHAWIHDPVLVVPDRANRIVWRVFAEPREPHVPTQRERFTAELWATLKQLMPVPLFDHWREPVLRAPAEDLAGRAAVPPREIRSAPRRPGFPSHCSERRKP
jgi:hypothetical protein